MRDTIFIFFTIFVVTGLIYILYRLMLGSDNDGKDNELQITSDEILEQLNILRKQKKYNIVESLAKNYLLKKSNDDGVRAILAKSMHDSGRIYDAIEQAKIIVKHQPNNFNVQTFMANCYLEVDKPMKAIAIFLEILSRDFYNVVAIKELSQIYFDTNQKKSALKMYKRLEDFLESDTEKAKNKAIIAEIHVEFKEFDMAIQEYEQILEIYPDDIYVKRRLVELYGVISDFDSLIRVASELYTAYASDINGLWAMKMLMEVYQIKHDYDRALEFAHLIREHSLSDKIQSGEDIAKILLEKNQIEDSIEMLKALIVQDPKNIELKETLADAYERKQDFESAISIYKKLLDDVEASDIEQIHYEISTIYANWAIHLFAKNESDECFKRFIIALQYYSKNPDLYYQIGNVNKAIKNFNESIAQYKKAIELDSTNVNYYYAIAECYQKIDSIYEQKKALTESLKYNSNNAEVYYELGLIYQLQNDTNSAISHIEKAIELDDNFVAAKCKLALIFEHVGNKEEAIRLYEEILRFDPQNEEVINNLKMIKS